MRKIFTFAIAVLASISMWANYEPTADEVIYLQADAYDANAADAGYSKHAAISWAGTVSFSDKKAGDPANDGALTSSNVKTCSVKGNGGGKNMTISIEGCSKIILYHEKQSSRYVEFRKENKTGELLAKSEGNSTYTEVELDASTAYNIFLHGVKDDGGDQDLYVYAVKLIKGADDGQPKLSAAPAEITLEATAAVPAPSAKVRFTGKNLTAGSYNLVVPNVAGLSAAPTSVTVAEDGKLNAEVTITYAPTADAAAASANISLTIGELNASVAVSYSAVMAKSYLSKSVNIEQWVLDNGKNNAAFRALLDEANIEYKNIDELDSLNDSKDYRNYPFLGQKMKKADATLACWLEKGHSIVVKFGNVGADFKVIANGSAQTLTAADYANTTAEGDKVLTMSNAPEDMYLEIVCNSTKTLVVKQIMLDEAAAAIVLPDTPTAIENTNSAVKAVKVVRDGQMMILKNGILYNMQGAVVK